jgi:chloride channel 7
MAGFESQDFDPVENDIQRSFALHRPEHDYLSEDTFRWLLAILIGTVMGLLAFLVDWGIEGLNSFKFSALRQSILLNNDSMTSSSLSAVFNPWFTWTLTSVGFALIAGSLVSFVEPLAAGSGIPEMKTYLNGVHVRGLLTLRTLVAKLTGIVFSIAAGLTAGKEGPFVHGGGIVGGGVGGMGSQTITRWLNGSNISKSSSNKRVFKTPREVGGQFRNAADHRDFTAIGTAAGVATAFAAPIGGLLFCIEEGVSFYSTSVFWRGFLSTCIGVFVLHILADAKDHPGQLLSTKFGRFRDFGLYTDNDANLGSRMFYYIWDLPIFCCIGALGGLAGAGFIKANVKVTQWRHTWVPTGSRWKRLAEVVLLAVLTTSLWFLFAYISPCAPLPSEEDLKFLIASGSSSSSSRTDAVMEDFFGGGGGGGGGGTTNGPEHFPQLWCQLGEYSTWGQFFMTPLSQALRIILHLGEPLPADRPDWHFSTTGLMLFTISTFGAMCVTNGVGASTGMFVPSLTVGAGGGRLIGHLVQWLFASPLRPISLPTYAVIGAAAFLGGATRMTLTTTVMVMETTGALQLIVPLMITVFFSKVVGDRFGVGIDDTHVRLRGAPVLQEPGLELEQQLIDDKLTAAELATGSLITLPPVVSVNRLIQVLKSNHHQAFPVTPDGDDDNNNNNSDDDGIELHGLILRSTLLAMLEHRLGFVRTTVHDKKRRANNNSNDDSRWDVGRGGGSSSSIDHTSSSSSSYNNAFPLPRSQSQRQDVLEQLEQIPIKIRIREDQECVFNSVLTELAANSNSDDSMVMMDLRPFMQRSPFVINEQASLSRAYRLFRTMGLRHMFVGPTYPRVRGIITRKDIITDNGKLALGRKATTMMGVIHEDDVEQNGGGDRRSTDRTITTAANTSNTEPLPGLLLKNKLPFIPYSAYDPTALSS